MTDLRALLEGERPPQIVPASQLVRLVRERAHERRIAIRRRVGTAALAVAAAAAGLTLIAPEHNFPSYVAGTLATGMGTCGRVPESTGPKENLLHASVTAPAQAASGAGLEVSVNLATSSKEPVTTLIGDVQVVLARDGYIVGKYPDNGGRSSKGIAAGPISASRSGSVPGFVTLRGCPHGPTDQMHPDDSRPALETGTYDLVGIVTDDPGPPSDRTVIVSTPAMITVS